MTAIYGLLVLLELQRQVKVRLDLLKQNNTDNWDVRTLGLRC